MCVDIAKYWVAMVPQGYEPVEGAEESTCRMLFGCEDPNRRVKRDAYFNYGETGRTDVNKKKRNPRHQQKTCPLVVVGPFDTTVGEGNTLSMEQISCPDIRIHPEISDPQLLRQLMTLLHHYFLCPLRIYLLVRP